MYSWYHHGGTDVKEKRIHGATPAEALLLWLSCHVRIVKAQPT